MILEKEAAYILHTAPHLDKTKLVCALTANHGWFRLVARASAKLTGLPMEPFTPLLLSCGGRGKLPAVRMVEITAPARLHSARTKMLGMYFNEMMMKLMKSYVPCADLFIAYDQGLTRLSKDPEDEWALRHFEVALLEAAGHGLNLTHDTAGHELRATARYIYRPDDGAAPAPGEQRKGTVDGLTLLCLGGARVSDADEHRREAKQLMRYLIDYYLQGKTIRTRLLFRYLEEQHAAK